MKRYLCFGIALVACAMLAGAGARGAQQDSQPLDKEFLVKTITCTHAEVKASELAESRTSNAKVKQFAHQLVKDHTAVNEKLGELAKTYKVAVVAGTEKETKDMLAQLSSLRDAALDKAYLKCVIDEHEKAIRMFENQEKNGTDNQLKTFAKDTLPHLRKHLDEAKNLAAEVK